MKNKALTAVIVVLAVILAGLIALLVYLELDRRPPETPAATGQSSTAASQAEDTTAAPEETRVDPATDPENPLNTQPPAFTIPEAEPDQDTPPVPVDPMGPASATEGPEVDPELGADDVPDPTENELPIVG